MSLKNVSSKMGSFFYRLTKHDTTRRIKPQDIDPMKPFHLGVSGFKGCPFCARAIACSLKLQEEVGTDALVLTITEHDNRFIYKDFLFAKRRDLAQNTPGAGFHTSSPICWVTDMDQYIGGLDDLLEFLGHLPQFSKSKTLKEYKPENPLSTFFKGVPGIVKNFKSVLGL